MDMVNVVRIALFIPFVLMLTIFAIVYLISGYKKDLGRSLVSLGATVAATLLSLLLAKGISRLVAPLLAKAVPADLFSEMDGLGLFADNLVQGVIEVVLSFLLFGLFFIVGLAVLKSVGKRIPWGKLDNLNTGKVGTRLAGLGLRALDAVLVTVMLLLPLYGTIAVVAPPAAAVVRISADTAPMQRGNVTPDTAEDETLAILEMMAEHPALLPYKYGPGQWVYSGLSVFAMNGKSVDIAAVAQSLEGLLERVQAVQTAIETEDEQRLFPAMEELIDYTRHKVVNQRWSYHMLMAMLAEMDAQAETAIEDEELATLYQQLRPLMDMSYSEYKHNAELLLDLTADYIRQMERFQQGEELTPQDLQALADRAKALFEESEQLRGLQDLLLPMMGLGGDDTAPDSADGSIAYRDSVSAE